MRNALGAISFCISLVFSDATNAASDNTKLSIDWQARQENGICILATLPAKRIRISDFVQERQSSGSVLEPFLEIVHDESEYVFRARLTAMDDLQFRIWAAGGFTKAHRLPSGEDVILTPAISHVARSFLAASGSPAKSIWTTKAEFDEEKRLFTASGAVDREKGFGFLLDRAEARVLYVFVPSEIGTDKSWEIDLGISFRNAMAEFIRCQEGKPS